MSLHKTLLEQQQLFWEITLHFALTLPDTVAENELGQN